VPLGTGGVACYPFCRMSGLKDPAVPLYPAAQTIASPGAVETDVSTLGLPSRACVPCGGRATGKSLYLPKLGVHR
jgi:hypothetical protein